MDCHSVQGGAGGRALYPSAKGRVEYQLSTKESVKHWVRGTWVCHPIPNWLLLGYWGVGYEYWLYIGISMYLYDISKGSKLSIKNI